MESEDERPEIEIELPHTNTPQSFTQFLLGQRSGEVHAEISEKLRDLIEAIETTYNKFPGKTVGELNLKIKISVDRGAYKVATTYAIKMPGAPVAEQVMWLAADGSLQSTNPKQLTMFGEKPRVVV